MVKFKQDTHQYFLEDRELISVSAFTKRFIPYKDWKKVAAKTAKAEGKTTQELLDLWELKRKKGSDAGTIVHKIREEELINDPGCKLSKKMCPVINGCKTSLPISEVENNHIYPELMIYDTEHMICGQSDKVIIQDNKINIYDIKTDKEIKSRAFSSPWVKPEKLLPPLAHLDNCDKNIYCIKMSLYMYLLWKANRGKFKPGKIILEWNPIQRDEEGFPILYDGKPKVLFSRDIELPYRKKEVIDMLKTLK